MHPPPRKFLSTPSARRATGQAAGDHGHKADFYPRPPRGGRPYNGSMFTKSFEISIHALREEGDGEDGDVSHHAVIISIHALREEGDVRVSALLCGATAISIHALREEGDHGPVSFSPIKRLFLSTPSARRATMDTFHSCCHSVYFYPRPPRGGRPNAIEDVLLFVFISIHALREEGDPITKPCSSKLFVFLSTPSARRATYGHPDKGKQRRISIHALREEGDG